MEELRASSKAVEEDRPATSVVEGGRKGVVVGGGPCKRLKCSSIGSIAMFGSEGIRGCLWGGGLGR